LAVRSGHSNVQKDAVVTGHLQLVPRCLAIACLVNGSSIIPDQPLYDIAEVRLIVNDQDAEIGTLGHGQAGAV